MRTGAWSTSVIVVVAGGTLTSMNEPESDPQETSPTVVGADQDRPSVAAGDGDELRVLDQLESDLLAVDNAIAALDQLASAGSTTMNGEELEAAIEAAVPLERFTAPVPGNGGPALGEPPAGSSAGSPATG